MGKVNKKKLIILILVVSIIDAAIGYFLFRSRAFSHLAIWNIIESNERDDFYWQPKDAPEYFYFEPPGEKISVFRNEIYPLIRGEGEEFRIALKVASHVMDISSENKQPYLALRWDSPEGMLRQVREGASANCFHRAILLSAYLSSLGIKSRLWTLENDNFNAVSHSVNEVYIPRLKKWVFMDVMFGFYASENEGPLSFLELRSSLLRRDADEISFKNIHKTARVPERFLLDIYRRLVKTVFLRSGNDFVNKFNPKIRYGVFHVFANYIDKLPNSIRIGLSYLFGRKEAFVHYVDEYSRSLKEEVIFVKTIFYFFVFSLAAVGIILISLLRKDTLHR